jgi:hypothetical protein
VSTCRDVHELNHQRLVPDEWFPVFVKPASWDEASGASGAAIG